MFNIVQSCLYTCFCFFLNLTATHMNIYRWRTDARELANAKNMTLCHSCDFSDRPRQQLQEGGRHSSTCKREAVTHWPQLHPKPKEKGQTYGRLRLEGGSWNPSPRGSRDCSGVHFMEFQRFRTCHSLNLSHLRFEGNVWIKQMQRHRTHARR